MCLLSFPHLAPVPGANLPISLPACPPESIELLSEFVARAPEQDAEDVQKVRALLRGLRQQQGDGGGGDANLRE